MSSMQMADGGLEMELRRLVPMPVASDAAEPGALEAESLSVWYGDKQVLESIDLAMESRRITALIGPSGCGKSTFLRCLNRMNDLVSAFRHRGVITLDGQDVYASNVSAARLRRTVGMVFQHPNPFPMSIWDNVAMGVQEHRPHITRSALAEVVERSLRQATLWEEVKDDLGRSAFALSGGQQQRLCIARALAIEPTVLMLDEPCASLDPVSTAHIERLLLELKQTYTVVIVTHNLAQARRISDKTAFFLQGRLVESGPTHDVFTAPKAEETGQYLAGAFG